MWSVLCLSKVVVHRNIQSSHDASEIKVFQRFVGFL